MLAATVLGSSMAMLDATVVNVSLPRLGADLGAAFDGLQWVVNAYTLTLASLILVGGSLGDRLGRRKVFVVGVVWFAAASMLCGVAPSVGFLIAARALQGVGGALLTPGSLAIIEASFEHADRPRAIGLWSGLGGVAAAAGPFVGGWLVDVASWRWVFFVNVPVALAVVLIAVRHVPESRDPDAAREFDVLGTVVGALALAATTQGLVAGSWFVTALGIALLVAFVAVEATSRHPMMPLSLFRDATFSASNGLTFLVYGALSMMMFLLGITLQVGLGYSPIAAGAALLPVTAIMLFGSSRSGALAQRIGPRLPMTVGPVLLAVGLLLLTRVEPGRSYLASVFPAAVVFGLGLALTVAPLTSAVLASAEERHAGIASGVNNAVARAAGLLAIAALPIIAGFDASSTVGGAELVDGLHRAVTLGALACLGGAVVAWMFVRNDVLHEPLNVPAKPWCEQQPTYNCPVGDPPRAVLEECVG